ncbi:MAG: hypothetical protein EBT61_11340 [Verrucomicrobia bacterium]|nr:hypothetical protein [Verrucomicrobiota bacterium]
MVEHFLAAGLELDAAAAGFLQLGAGALQLVLLALEFGELLLGIGDFEFSSSRLGGRLGAGSLMVTGRTTGRAVVRTSLSTNSELSKSEGMAHCNQGARSGKGKLAALAD